MSNYRRKSTPVLAWQFTGQPNADWPAWVRDYMVSTNMGAEKIGLSAVGTVLVPSRNGTQTMLVGDWLVLENYGEKADGSIIGGQLQIARGADFERMFEPNVAPTADAEPTAE